MKLIRRFRKWLSRLTSEGLYARIKGRELLDHEAREEILAMLKREPGLCFQEIQERVGLAPGTTRWHLDKLASSDFVTSDEDGRHTRFFPTGLDPGTRKAVVAMRDESRLALVRMIERNPELSQSDLADATGLAQSTVSHHLGRLVEDGIVDKHRDGRSVRYAIEDEMTKPVREAKRYVL
jgi:DNA-binding transcriptional ArsR family regulator